MLCPTGGRLKRVRFRSWFLNRGAEDGPRCTPELDSLPRPRQILENIFLGDSVIEPGTRDQRKVEVVFSGYSAGLCSGARVTW